MKTKPTCTRSHTVHTLARAIRRAASSERRSGPLGKANRSNPPTKPNLTSFQTHHSTIPVFHHSKSCRQHQGPAKSPLTFDSCWDFRDVNLARFARKWNDGIME